MRPQLLPGIVGALALVAGVAQVVGNGFACITAGLLLLALDRRL